jgi:hypothetical protein
VPCIRLGHLTEIQKQAYVIVDNKLGLNAGWDDDMLRLEYDELKSLGFDVDLTGFDPSEFLEPDIDYSMLNDEDMGDQIESMQDGVKRAIQIEFEACDYEEAKELVKYFRDQKHYVGGVVIAGLKNAKNRT